MLIKLPLIGFPVQTMAKLCKMTIQFSVCINRRLKIQTNSWQEFIKILPGFIFDFEFEIKIIRSNSIRSLYHYCSHHVFPAILPSDYLHFPTYSINCGLFFEILISL